ncbi:MAG: hypothetical protein R2762_22095 [Bryobacteraceae bacterium]
MPQSNDSFYVGYAPKAGATARRWMTGVTLLLLALTGGLALSLAYRQKPFADARFEFGIQTEFAGRITMEPYPALIGPQGSWWLVAPGKFGFNAAAWAGEAVTLSGERVERGADAMIQVLPGSVRRSGVELPEAKWERLGSVSLMGEVVDSKCFLGVMNPGEGEVHRGCAVRCISGGVPPGLRVKDRDGTVRIVLLAGPGGEPMRARGLALAGEAVRAAGVLYRSGNLRIIHAGEIARVKD